MRRVLEGESPRYDSALLRADLLALPVRRFTNFSGDLSGRNIGARSAAAGHREIPDETLRLVVREDCNFSGVTAVLGVRDRVRA